MQNLSLNNFKNKPNVIAFIPARGGSKGLPNKNILEIAGKPLIAWTIEYALKSEHFDSVVVSTDCKDIANVARAYGANVPFLRPEHLSTDESTTEEAMAHCYEFFDNLGISIDIMALLQCTSPLRFQKDLERAFACFWEKKYDSLLTISEDHRFYWKIGKNLISGYDYKKRPRRQDIQKADRQYVETGSIYISRTDGLIKYKNRLHGKIGYIITGPITAYEIDNLSDFIICEALLEKGQINE
jgi:CMP-N,N'-diacetyllegionaminic acid synthase